MTPEQETEFLAAFESLQDTVADQGLLIAQQGLKIGFLERENTDLRESNRTLTARVDALEHENVELKLSVANLVREQERYDERLREHTIEINGLQQRMDVRGERLETFQRHLEEQARDALEARTRKG